MAGLTPEDSIFGKKAETDGESSHHGDVGSSPLCPRCKSKKVWRDAKRYTPNGFEIQRWSCRNCGVRFSDPNDTQRAKEAGKAVETVDTKSLKMAERIVTTCQICVTETKNLVAGPQTTEVLREKSPDDIKGKLVQFAWKMQQDGYNKETIRCDGSCLRALILRGADLNDPESVKTVLSKEQKWSQSRKSNAINAYTLFLKFKGMSWTKPKCPITRKFPFIPSEQEIDALIAGSNKKHPAYHPLLKATAMRSGEAKRLQWTDIDKEKRVITLNDPEKGSNPRMWRVSETLIEMLNAQSRTTQFVFNGSLRAMKTTLDKTRKRLAERLQNPRLLRIHYHTFRHWKATMLYHQTKDPYYVQHFLGHKSITSTEIYINIEHTLFEAGANDQFTVRITEKPEEIKEYLEAGFEYVCQKDNLIFLRKRK